MRDASFLLGATHQYTSVCGPKHPQVRPQNACTATAPTVVKGQFNAVAAMVTSTPSLALDFPATGRPITQPLHAANATRHKLLSHSSPLLGSPKELSLTIENPLSSTQFLPILTKPLPHHHPSPSLLARRSHMAHRITLISLPGLQNPSPLLHVFLSLSMKYSRQELSSYATALRQLDANWHRLSTQFGARFSTTPATSITGSKRLH